MKKYHSEYKYDIALTMPIYKIGKDKIREIKDTFDGIHLMGYIWWLFLSNSSFR